MKNETTLHLKQYPVLAVDHGSGEGNEEITRTDLEFLLGCALDLAKCLERGAKDHFDNSCCGAGEFNKEDIQISGNLLNRADELRSYVKELAEKYSVVMDDG